MDNQHGTLINLKLTAKIKPKKHKWFKMAKAPFLDDLIDLKQFNQLNQIKFSIFLIKYMKTWKFLFKYPD